MRWIALILASLLTEAALPCSFPPNKPFVVGSDKFEQKLSAGQLARLPAPRVQIIEVTRGTQSAGASCNDAGLIKVRVTWPTTNAYSVDEIGFYFRVRDGLESRRRPGLETIVVTL
jgi:hypothetical protein